MLLLYKAYYKVNYYCPNHQLFHFPDLKTVKQMEEMKQLAVGWNNWKKSGILISTIKSNKLGFLGALLAPKVLKWKE